MKWDEALPIGNGRLGGMVFGDEPLGDLTLPATSRQPGTHTGDLS